MHPATMGGRGATGDRGKHHSDVNATRLRNMVADAMPAAEIMIRKWAPNFRMRTVSAVLES